MAKSLPKRLAIGSFAISVTILAISGLLTHRNVLQFKQRSWLVEESHQLLTHLSELPVRMYDMRLFNRNYFLSGNRADLDLYYAAEREMSATLDRLRALSAKDPRRLARVEELALRLAAHQQWQHAGLELKDREGRNVSADAAWVAEAQSRALLVVSSVRTLEAEEGALLAERQTRARQMASTAEYAALFALGAGVALLGLSFAQLLKELSVRLRAEEQLRAVNLDLESRVLTSTTELEAANVGLEQRVAMRTAELDHSVESLRHELVERERAEDALQESRDYAWALFDHIPSPIWRADPDGKCDYVNRAWREFTGKTTEEGRGDGWADGLHPDDREQCVKTQRQAFHTRQPFYIEYRMMHKDGNYHLVAGNARPYDDLHGKFAGYLGVCYDLTARKAAEDALLTLSERLMRAQEEERRHIARELHDSTGQELTAALMTLGALIKDKGLSPHARKLADDIGVAIQKCLADLRGFSYLLHPPLLEDLGLGPALKHYAQGYTERSGIPVNVQFDAGSNGASHLSPECAKALFRVAQESLTNIHNHAQSPKAEIRFSCAAGGVQLEVQDFGVGIPPDVLARQNGGMARLGVGIAGMRERIRQLGGKLKVDSGSSGTRITAWLPIHEHNQEAVP